MHHSPSLHLHAFPATPAGPLREVSSRDGTSVGARRPVRGLCDPWSLALPPPAVRQRPTVPGDLPRDPAAYAHTRRLLAMLLETVTGQRRLSQVAETVEPTVLRYLSVVVDQRPRRGHHDVAWVASMRICQPTIRVAEVAAVCRIGGRTRALAARFERLQGDRIGFGGWRCHAIQLG